MLGYCSIVISRNARAGDSVLIRFSGCHAFGYDGGIAITSGGI